MDEDAVNVADAAALFISPNFFLFACLFFLFRNRIKAGPPSNIILRRFFFKILGGGGGGGGCADAVRMLLFVWRTRLAAHCTVFLLIDVVLRDIMCVCVFGHNGCKASRNDDDIRYFLLIFQFLFVEVSLVLCSSWLLSVECLLGE